MSSSLVRTSKFLSLILRHNPGQIGLTLDGEGWADVDELLMAAVRSGVQIDRSILERVVAENDKKRFAFNPDGTRIRANQGHSVPVELGLVPQVPPEILYHGTASRFLDSIRREGLRPGQRTHVHLSEDEATAHKVGQRHGKPAILLIAAGRMLRDGYEFLCSENGVWLTKSVPTEYIQFPQP
jgi:putative RNA 2'-phosphotransferase